MMVDVLNRPKLFTGVKVEVSNRTIPVLPESDINSLKNAGFGPAAENDPKPVPMAALSLEFPTSTLMLESVPLAKSVPL